VWFSVVACFVLYSLGPVLLLGRSEAWLLALALMCVADPYLIWRLLEGRPYLIVSAVVPLVYILWPRLAGERPARVVAFFAACAAFTTWIHHGFYLLAFPVLGLLAAREWRAGTRLAVAFALGIMIGALLTGHPIGYLYQSLLHAYLVVGLPKPMVVLAAELEPFEGRPQAVAAFLALVAWRATRERNAFTPTRDPAVAMAVGGWALGFFSQRFYFDWAVPALLALGAVGFDRALRERLPATVPAYVLITAAPALLLVLVIGADVQARWSNAPGPISLSSDDPAQAEWLPDPGGIAYDTEMVLFDGLFFRNPQGPWKYVLGFEPAIMRPEDYEVFTAIHAKHGKLGAYRPWVDRMRPEDRLYIISQSTQHTQIPLQWYQPVPSLWVGRLPR